MDIQTKDGIVLKGIPEGTPDDAIKARIEQIRASAQTQEQPAPSGGMAANLAAGSNENIASFAGFPARLVNAIGAPGAAAGSYVGKALRELTGKAPIGAPSMSDLIAGQKPEMPPDSMGRLSGTPNDIQDAMGQAGFDPRTVEAVTPGEKFARGAGRGLVDALSVAMPATVVANASKAGTATNAIAKALAAQPVTQAVSTATGEGTTDATGSPALGLATSLLTAGGMGAGKSLIDQTGARKGMVNSAPTTDALRGQANQAYKAADDAGLVVTGNSFGNAVKNIEDAAVSAGIDKDIHPKASAVLRRLAEEADTPKTLQDLDILRRVAKSAASSIEPDERRIGSIMVDKLDDYVSNLKPADVASGDAAAANGALTDARDLWSRMKKSDLIEGIMEKAKTQASGEENGLRIGFRQLLNNKKALRGFSDDEVDAIKQVAEGTMTGNALRKLGKLGFGSGAQSNFLGGSIGAGAGFHVGGPVGALVVPAAGYAAQKASQASTRSAANYARALAASGPSAAPVNQSLSQALLNPTKGPNAALLAKVLAEQSRYPALNLSQREVQQ